MKSSTPLTLTSRAWFQLVVVKLSEAGEVVATSGSRLAIETVTVPEGAVRSLTV
ncbi:MAG: hypothetical protein OXG96_14935 [Acidobacteria bacterium]|nr:hypothetical protein [Acidobacteriota bacterium]